MNYINYSHGAFLYKDVHFTSQVTNVQIPFEKLLVEQNFDTILEIGTLFGGLTFILNDIRNAHNLKAEIHTIDLDIKPWLVEEFPKLNINYLHYDVNYEPFKIFINEFVPTKGKVLILCDGGNKVYEFNLISDYIKPGDFIMAHDYISDKDKFESEYLDKIWNFHEVCFDDIRLAVERNNLELYTSVDFDKYVWACYQKK